MSLEQDLFAIEKQFWTGGPQAYLDHANDECLLAFGEMSGVMSKEKIAETAEKGRWSDPQLEQKGLMELSGDSAVLTYEAHVTRKDGEPYHALVSSGYVRRDGEWKLAFHQQTPLKN